MTGHEDIPSDFEQMFAQFPVGYIEGQYEGKTWGAVVKRSADGRRAWLFAEELGGTDIVSFNLYRRTGRVFLKPCEMSSTKVVRFVTDFRPQGRSAMG